MNKLYPAIGALSLGAALIASSGDSVIASSHREAPAIAEDQYVDNTDVYAFISPQSPDRLVMVANNVPLLIPSSGPNYSKFSANARYEIHVDNDGDAKDDITYRWEFTDAVKNGNTFLYNTGPIELLSDPDLNVTQTYDLWRIDHKSGKRTRVMDNAPVAPWNVGKRSFPSGYEPIALQAVTEKAGVRSFAGPRDAALRVLANRGVNCIDGQVSAALGASAALAVPTVLWCGDLALLHDVSGLLAGRLHGADLTIVVTNDDGGGIFEYLPVASAVPRAVWSHAHAAGKGKEAEKNSCNCK